MLSFDIDNEEKKAQTEKNQMYSIHENEDEEEEDDGEDEEEEEAEEEEDYEEENDEDSSDNNTTPNIEDKELNDLIEVTKPSLSHPPSII